MGNITVEKAIELLRDGRELMVKPYDNDHINFTGISLEDFEGQSDAELSESLKDYTNIQYWPDVNDIEVIN